MNIVNIILHLVFISSGVFTFINVSQAYSKIFLFIVILFLMSFSLLQKKRYVRWPNGSFTQTGLVFLTYYVFALSLGPLYQYEFEYYAVNIMWIFPLFFVIFIPSKIEIEKIFNIILFYSIITVFFSFLELLALEQIPFLYQKVKSTLGEKGISNIYDKEQRLRLFGIFNTGVTNGLVIVMGFVVIMKKMKEKFNIIYPIGMVSYLTIIYFTYTRNNYFTIVYAIILWSILQRLHKRNIKKFIYFFTSFAYIGMLSSAIMHALYLGGYSLEINSFTGTSSVQSRVISWALIIKNYLLSEFPSTHTLFGYAITQLQNDAEPIKSYWIIDNSFLMIFLGSGIVGVLFFIHWFKSAINELYNQFITANKKEAQNILTVMVIFSLYIINGAMNASVLTTVILLPLLIMISNYSRFSRA